jgi:hypothetical protein
MKARHINSPIWAGFLLSVVAFGSYPAFFAQFPLTRDVPWANYLMFGAAAVLLAAGLRRAFAQPARYRGKLAGPILTVASVVAMGLFLALVFFKSRGLPASHGAPQVGQKAPDFTLPDINGNPVSLSSLLAEARATAADHSKPPHGVLLIFYRGYW